MRLPSLPRRALAFGAIFGALALGACDDDDPSNPGPVEPEVASMRLSTAAQTIEVSDNGTVTGGPLTFGVGISDVTVEFLDGLGDVITDFDGDVFEAQATSGNETVVTVARTGPFDFRLTGLNAGNITVSFSLYHIDEDHDDFGPFPVPVEVTGGGV